MVNLQEAVIMVTAVAVAVVFIPTRNAEVPIGEKGEEPSAPPKYERCPKRCKCSRGPGDNFSALDLQCGEQSLSSVPTITDNDIQISVLNLSFNHLNNLTLSGYQSAKYLYLQHCKLNTIDEKAFYGFKNLMVVDLSNNLLTSIPPDLFADNHLLDTLILRNNILQDTDPNTPFLNGPASLRSLDLQSCKLSTLSPVTFSSLPNLRFLDISSNKLVVLDSECLHFLHKLEVINMESNPLECGAKFEDLLCWIQRKLVASRNGTLDCQHDHDNKTLEEWPPDKRTSFCCDSCTAPSLPEVYKPEVTETTTVSPMVSFLQEILNSCWWLPLIIGMFVGIFFTCVCAYIINKTRSSLRENQLHSEETHIALEDSEEREEESRSRRRRRRRRQL